MKVDFTVGLDTLITLGLLGGTWLWNYAFLSERMRVLQEFVTELRKETMPEVRAELVRMSEELTEIRKEVHR